VSEQQELDRLLPVIDAVKQRLDIIISLDTSTPQVMLEGAKLGAGLINDVRALQRDGGIGRCRTTKVYHLFNAYARTAEYYATTATL
jgi:dihydropteroate synthase